MFKRYNITGIFFLLFLLITGCKKEEFVTSRSAKLNFSTDTVYFDTILSTLGSVTKHFKIYNTHDQAIRIQELYIAGGEDSQYRLNVDGVKGKSFSDIDIMASDSMYVFVEVTIDPTGSNSPMIVEDSIIFITNENLQDVNLFAFGQDVTIFRNEIIKSQTWSNIKPYLILDNVAVDSLEKLTILPGTRIFLHNYSSLIIWGQVEASGTMEEPVYFMNDRFDFPYDQAAGQWGTIYIDPISNGNIFEYVVIKNANAGIQIGLPGEDLTPSLEIRNSMILNSASYGIYSFGANIEAYNTVIADCGLVALGLFLGGEYNFYHCSISNIGAYYPSIVSGDYKSRSTPSLFFSNYLDWYEIDENLEVTDVTYTKDLNINFVNSILYGIRKQEILFDRNADAGFEYMFDHCLIKNHEDSLDYEDPVHFSNIVLNEDPEFINDSISTGDYDFGLESGSPAINAGNIDIIQGIPQLETDFNGNSRFGDGFPDIGAYERYE